MWASSIIDEGHLCYVLWVRANRNSLPDVLSMHDLCSHVLIPAPLHRCAKGRMTAWGRLAAVVGQTDEQRWYAEQ